MAANVDFSKLTKGELEILAKAAFTPDSEQEPDEETMQYGYTDPETGETVGKHMALSKGKGKKGPTYGGLSMAEMMSELQNSSPQDLLQKYGRNPDIKWGY